MAFNELMTECAIYPFHVNAPFLYQLKTSEKTRGMEIQQFN